MVIAPWPLTSWALARQHKFENLTGDVLITLWTAAWSSISAKPPNVDT